MEATTPATVLAIATASPENVVEQKTYPDFFFGVTNCDQKVEMKKKFQRICANSGVERRRIYLTKEILEENPSMCTYMENSLNARHDILEDKVPELASKAAEKAIQQWGRKVSDITHLVFATISGVGCPGADQKLIKLLGLNRTVNRVMVYQQGCFVGGTVMRIAKDLSENNKQARVLVCCSEISVATFRAPHESHIDGLVGSALFGDGAAAVIVGSDPSAAEKAMFEIHFAMQTLLPDSEYAIIGKLKECGIIYYLSPDVPKIVSANLGEVLEKLMEELEAKQSGTEDDHKELGYNDLFWVVHPGGPAILDQIEKKLHLDKEKLAAGRCVLAEHGNMSGVSVLFVLHEMLRRSVDQRNSTTGGGARWGIMLGFGPGITVEALLLKSVTI